MYNSLQIIIPSIFPFGKISIQSESIIPLKFPLTITLWAKISPLTTPSLPIIIVFLEFIFPSNSPSI